METEPNKIKPANEIKFKIKESSSDQLLKIKKTSKEAKLVNNKDSIPLPEAFNISNLKLFYEIILFAILNTSFLNKVCTAITINLTQLKNLTINKILKKVVFNHFCGGETIQDCICSIKNLYKYGIKTILDYSKESGGENTYNNTVNEIIKVIDKASGDKRLSHAVFKESSIANPSILEKISNGEYSEMDIQKFEEVKKRTSLLCEHASKKKIKILIDAEQSWIQPAIDEIARRMMIKYNKNEPIVFNTVQMYRTGRIDYLKELHNEMKSMGVKLGLKIVRGAYMETERERASQQEYKSPIQLDYESTTRDFHNAIDYCIQNRDTISIVAGTHNIESIEFIKKKMRECNIKNEDEEIYFAQLYGMANHISESLAKDGYNIAKYVPYGKVEETLPYLIRRFEENKSFNGQISGELKIRIYEAKKRISKNYK